MSTIAMPGAILAALLGCSPLPGDSLDPLYFKHGGGTEAPPAEPSASPSSGDPAPSLRAATAPADSTFSPWLATEINARRWVGRYRDSRGEGDVTFSLRQGGSTVSGTWVRAGGGGPVTAVAEASGGRFSLRMENTAPECPGTFKGWIALGTTALVGAYHGDDCDGPVADGWLELHPE